jgi:hypothetical protein
MADALESSKAQPSPQMLDISRWTNSRLYSNLLKT